tara:strand:- start:684 stop:869 length:186 start_codon:yes stop_codon:yes gene_type:complete
MTRLFLILIIVTQLGCAEFIGFAIGTASNVTGDLIVDYIENEEKKDAENSPSLKDLQVTKP